MRFAFMAVFLLGLVLCQPARSESSPELLIQRDITYANPDGHPLKLNLYVPEGAQSAPLVVWIHGGGWRAGSRNKPKLLELTESGYALASISYRFTDKAIFPAQIHDCKAAIRWLRAHSEQYGYNANSIAVGGSSAGGHLALLLGVSGDVDELEGNVGRNPNQSSRVQAVIDYYGPSDFILRGKTQPERAFTEKSGSFALLGGVRDGKLSVALQRKASPAQYVSADDPPLLIFHGDADQTVLLDQSERIMSLYTDAGLDVELVVLKGARHGGANFFRGQHLDHAKQFIMRNGSSPSSQTNQP